MLGGLNKWAKASNKWGQVDDGIFKPGGITHMMGPSGVFALNPRDSVMATTNRINDGIMTGPEGSLPIGGGLTREQGDRMIALLDKDIVGEFKAGTVQLASERKHATIGVVGHT